MVSRTSFVLLCALALFAATVSARSLESVEEVNKDDFELDSDGEDVDRSLVSVVHFVRMPVIDSIIEEETS